jgi:GT2 family glycosyltransferase
LGGYRERLVFYGEEKDFCLRALHAGHRTVYLPDALVGHVPDPGGRSASRYVRFVIRNDCLYSLYNEPWPLAAISLPVRLWRYRRMNGPNHDDGGFRWIASELAKAFADIRLERNPVSWATILEWRRLARTNVPYVPPNA